LRQLHSLIAQLEELLHRSEEFRHELRQLHRHIDEIERGHQRIYNLAQNTNDRVHQIQNSLERINFGWVNDLQRRFSQLESMVIERVNHVDELFGNINLRFEYFNNKLHLINDKVENLFPSKKTRLRKKLNLTYKIRGRRRLDK